MSKDPKKCVRHTCVCHMHYYSPSLGLRARTWACFYVLDSAPEVGTGFHVKRGQVHTRYGAMAYRHIVSSTIPHVSEAKTKAPLHVVSGLSAAACRVVWMRAMCAMCLSALLSLV